MKFTNLQQGEHRRALSSPVVRIESSRVLWPDGELRPGVLTLGGGRIVAMDERHTGGRDALDCGDRLILPGMIDLHGDAFERQWMPRARVFFPLEIALMDTDRQLLANGITTAYHGLTVSWEPGLRGIEHGRKMVEALRRMRGQLQCDTRLHLRFEVYSIDEADELLRWIDAGDVHLVGFNDHLEMIAAHMEKEHKAGKYAERTGLTVAEFTRRLNGVRDRAAEVPGVVRQVANAAAARGIPLASHDDESPEMSRAYRALGCTICEFPVDAATARSAAENGTEVVLGCPNIVRGGSHAGRMAAADAVRDGLCTVLTSDYFYPSMLHGVFRLVREDVMPLEEAWSLVSSFAARAARLPDRGVLAEDLRADLTIVDDQDAELPRVCATIVGGKAVCMLDPELSFDATDRAIY
jgi:alpha-D-ribose 1-methylphosphonate 5-triphosphate diphosphatase